MMRRISAILLLIPFAALFLEWGAIASLCTPSQGSPLQANIAKATHTCCHDTRSHSTHQTRHGSTGCIDCPLCSLVTFKSMIRFDLTRPEIKIEYTVMPDNNLSDYFQQHWKPPNAFPSYQS